MKTVTIYTDGKSGCAAFRDVPMRSPLARQPRRDDRQAPSDRTAVWRTDGAEEQYL